MARRPVVVVPMGAVAAGSGAATAGTPAHNLDGEAERWDAEHGLSPSSPSAKKSKPLRRQPLVERLRRALFAPGGHHRRRQRGAAAAAASSAVLLVLLVTWLTAGRHAREPVLPGGAGQGQAAGVHAAGLQRQWVPGKAALQGQGAAASWQHTQLATDGDPGRSESGGGSSSKGMSGGDAGGGPSSAMIAAGAALVEFSAPGFLIPLRDALQASYPEQPAEAALLAVMPSAADGSTADTSAGASSMWAGVPPARPTLGEVLSQYDRRAGSAGSGSSGSLAKAGGSSSGAPSEALAGSHDGTDTAAAASDASAAAATGAGSAAPGALSPADVANHLQAAIQQTEEAARRARKAKREQQAGGQVSSSSSTGPAAAPQGQQAAKEQQNGAGRSSESANGRASSSAGSGGSSSGGSHGGIATGADVNSVASEEVQMLVGVVSSCCSAEAAARRQAIRETWGRTIGQHQPAIQLRFFLAQPPSAAALEAWMPIVQEEVVRHSDIVVLRGRDQYRNLPNKTLRFLRYALAHPAAYTHVLKTDDDCYVRIDRVLAALADPLDEAGQPQPPLAAASREDSPGMQGNLTSTAGAAAGAAWSGFISSSSSSGSSGGGGLPAMRKQLVEMMGRQSNPLHTDGIQLYNMTKMVEGSVGATGRRSVDDENGEPVTLEELASAAAAAVEQHKAQQQAAAAAPGEIAAAGGRGLAGGRQQLQQGPAAGGALVQPRQETAAAAVAVPPPRMNGVYLGCLENKGGFFPIRDPISKWYLSYRELPDSAVPFAVKYLAGWGVVLSRDMAQHAVHGANRFLAQGQDAPAWFRNIPFEDVMVGMLLMDAPTQPQDHPAFRAAWRACPSSTALKHLDVDAPLLFKGLFEQDTSGLWTKKPVQCSTGDFLPGDYTGWKRWRDALPSVAHI